MTADALAATVARLRELLQNDEGGTMSVWSVSSYIADECDRLTAALDAMRAENEALREELEIQLRLWERFSLAPRSRRK